MSKPEVKTELNDMQRDFRKNRFIEIIIENPDHPSIHDAKHITPEAKIAAVESLGITSSGGMDKPLSTGQKLGELIGDLYQLYLVEYRAFRKNRKHPIFCLVEEENMDARTSQFVQSASTNKSRNKGCLLLAMAMSMIILTSERLHCDTVTKHYTSNQDDQINPQANAIW
jgi:hypothetical protein